MSFRKVLKYAWGWQKGELLENVAGTIVIGLVVMAAVRAVSFCGITNIWLLGFLSGSLIGTIFVLREAVNYVREQIARDRRDEKIQVSQKLF